MPLLCWMYLVMGGILLFTITQVTAVQLMLMIDRYEDGAPWRFAGADSPEGHSGPHAG